MEFKLNNDQRSFQQELCQLLVGELTPEARRAHRDPAESSGYSWAYQKEFRKKLAGYGYIGIGWPKEHGGGGKNAVYETLFFEEMDYHGAPHLGNTFTYLPMGIILFGTDEQKRFFVPKIRATELDFFQGYSEPEAGSDLANLQCRAVLEGDEFVVNGQKLFSSEAHHADWGFVMVRTDPGASRHKGISILLIDMKSPGVSLGWYKTMSGWWHHGVYFDNVHVPRSNLLGEMNQGWYHAMAVLDYERASIGNPGHVVRMYDRLLAHCRETKRNESPLGDDPQVRSLLADLAADVAGARLTAYWVASMHSRGLHPQHEATLAALCKREAARRIQIAHMELMGAYSDLRRGSQWAPLDGAVNYDYLNDTFFHFAAGGFDINRNVIARRGLGLPRD